MRELEARYALPSTHLHSALLSEEDRSAWEAGLVTSGGRCRKARIAPSPAPGMKLVERFLQENRVPSLSSLLLGIGDE